MKKLLASVFALFLATPVFAQVSSTGVGTVYAKPDCAHLSFVIVTEHAKASMAHANNRTHSDAFFAILKKSAIEEKDAATTEFSINPKWTYPEKADPKLVGYVVTHHIHVKVRDLKNVGAILDAAVGDNIRLESIGFAVSDRAKFESQARDAAVADAKAKASQLMKGLGSRLGKVVSVSESIDVPRQGGYRALAAAPTGTGDGRTQVAAGEQAITVRVNVTWEVAHHHHHHHHKKK